VQSLPKTATPSGSFTHQPQPFPVAITRHRFSDAALKNLSSAFCSPKGPRYTESTPHFVDVVSNGRIGAFTLTFFDGTTKSLFSTHFYGRAAHNPVNRITRI
jgi:hypothetical protein